MRWQKALREELAGEVLAKQEIVPVQITPPAGAEGSGGYDPEEVSLQGHLRYAFRWEASRSICRGTHRLTIWPLLVKEMA